MPAEWNSLVLVLVLVIVLVLEFILELPDTRDGF